jgi:hypothetical protein
MIDIYLQLSECKYSMADDLLDKISRRKIVKTAGTGAVATLAGCSSQGEGNTDTTAPSKDSTPTQTDGAESETVGTADETDQQSTEQPGDTQSGETVYPGEEAIESTYEEAGGFWIQFDDPGSQLETPYQSSLLTEVPGGYNLEDQTFTGDGGTTEWDVLYVVIAPEMNDDGEYFTGLNILNGQRYNKNESYEENRGTGAVRRNSTGLAGEEEIEVFFEEDVNSYSDIVEDIPDELDEFV